MRKTVVTLSGLLLASLAVALIQWRELQAERARSADLQARLEAAAPPGPASQAAAVAQPAVTIDNTPASPPEPVAPPPATRPASTPTEADDARERRLLRDPRYRDAWRAQSRLAFANRRANFIRVLGFTPEQADAVIDLGLDHHLKMFDDLAAGTPIQMETEDPAHQASLRALLGEEKRLALQHYMETRSSRMEVDRFRTLLSGTEVLRDDQVEPLIDVLHPEQERLTRELREYRSTPDWVGSSPEAWRAFADYETGQRTAANERILAAAVGILSSAQLEQLDSMLRRDLERRRTQHQMTGLRAKLDRATEAAQPDTE